MLFVICWERASIRLGSCLTDAKLRKLHYFVLLAPLTLSDNRARHREETEYQLIQFVRPSPDLPADHISG